MPGGSASPTAYPGQCVASARRRTSAGGTQCLRHATYTMKHGYTCLRGVPKRNVQNAWERSIPLSYSNPREQAGAGVGEVGSAVCSVRWGKCRMCVWGGVSGNVWCGPSAERRLGGEARVPTGSKCVATGSVVLRIRVISPGVGSGSNRRYGCFDAVRSEYKRSRHVLCVWGCGCTKRQRKSGGMR